MTSIDDLRTEILTYVGDCLHNWSCVELEISNLYMALHEQKRDEFSHPIRAAFEAVISLEVRIAMIRAFVAAHPALTNDYSPHVMALCSRITKLYKKRHEIAHFMIVAHADNQSAYLSVRPFFTMDSFRSRRGTELRPEQIRERAISFMELATRINRHIQHVGAVLGLPAEYYVKEGNIAHPPLTKADLPPELQKSSPQS